MRQAAKDTRNAHFQDIVDKDIEIRDNIATTMQARAASSDRLSRAFEMIAIAHLTQTLGANAGPLLQQLFPNAPAPVLAAPAAAAAAAAAAPAPAAAAAAPAPAANQ